jgi:hypothetical protein
MEMKWLRTPTGSMALHCVLAATISALFFSLCIEGWRGRSSRPIAYQRDRHRYGVDNRRNPRRSARNIAASSRGAGGRCHATRRFVIRVASFAVTSLGHLYLPRRRPAATNLDTDARRGFSVLGPASTVPDSTMGVEPPGRAWCSVGLHDNMQRSVRHGLRAVPQGCGVEVSGA